MPYLNDEHCRCIACGSLYPSGHECECGQGFHPSLDVTDEVPKAKKDMTMTERCEAAGITIEKDFYKRKHDTDGYNMFLRLPDGQRIPAPTANKVVETLKDKYGICI